MIKLGRWFLRVFGLTVVAATLLLVRPALHTDSVGWLLVRFVFMSIAFCCGVAIAIISFVRVPGVRQPPAAKQKVRFTQDALDTIRQRGIEPPLPPRRAKEGWGKP